MFVCNLCANFKCKNIVLDFVSLRLLRGMLGLFEVGLNEVQLATVDGGEYQHGS